MRAGGKAPSLIGPLRCPHKDAAAANAEGIRSEDPRPNRGPPDRASAGRSLTGPQRRARQLGGTLRGRYASVTSSRGSEYRNAGESSPEDSIRLDEPNIFSRILELCPPVQISNHEGSTPEFLVSITEYRCAKLLCMTSDSRDIQSGRKISRIKTTEVFAVERKDTIKA